MKTKLTAEQHWRIVAYLAKQEAARISFVASQERAANLQLRLNEAQRAMAEMKTAAEDRKQQFLTEFNMLGTILGAKGDPNHWEIHIEDDPAQSWVEWTAEGETTQ